MNITELGYVRFGVSDLESWRTFAEEFIGLEVHPESEGDRLYLCLLYTSPSPRDRTRSRMPSSA